MKDNVWFTSDWHLGHNKVALLRGFNSVEEHDNHIISNINKAVGKRDKLFVLGDVAWKQSYLDKLSGIICRNMELIIGNHDTLQTTEYLKYFTKVHGFRKYKDVWLSHCPIHPQEMYRCRTNVHGHLHRGAGTPPLGFPYFNVNVDYNDYEPIGYSRIMNYGMDTYQLYLAVDCEVI